MKDSTSIVLPTSLCCTSSVRERHRRRVDGGKEPLPPSASTTGFIVASTTLGDGEGGIPSFLRYIRLQPLLELDSDSSHSVSDVKNIFLKIPVQEMTFNRGRRTRTKVRREEGRSYRSLPLSNLFSSNFLFPTSPSLMSTKTHCPTEYQKGNKYTD